MTALLRTEGVSKAFGGVQALSDCTIEVDEGSIAGLIGPNGSGKTTLFNVITGYGRVDSGDVYLGGKQDHQRRAGQGVRAGHRPDLPADPGLLPADRDGEHDRGRAAPRAAGTGWLRNPLARAGGPATRRRAMELLEFTGIAKPRRRTAPRPCPTASASCWSCPTC